MSETYDGVNEIFSFQPQQISHSTSPERSTINRDLYIVETPLKIETPL